MKKATARKLLKEELSKTPVISVACKKVGVSRQSFYRWTNSDTEFFEDMVKAMRSGIRYFNDIAESQLLVMIQEKNFSAVRYWLDRRHPMYVNGYYKDKLEAINQPKPQSIIIEVVDPETGEVTASLPPDHPNYHDYPR